MKSSIIVVLSFALLANLSCRKETPTAPPESKGTISFVEPKDSAAALESITIQIQVTSNQPLNNVVLTIDGSTVKIFTAPPYQFVWQTDTLPEASIHELDAKAYFKDGSFISADPRHIIAYHFTPSSLSARMVNDTLITLTWKDNSSRETGFDLQEGLNGSPFSSLQQLPANTTTTSVVGKYSIGDSLAFRVRALSDTLASNFSNTAVVPIDFPAPSNLVLISLSDTEVKLSWQDNAAFTVDFVVEHSTNGMTYSALAIVGKNASPAAISDTFKVDSTHYFRVRARSTINISSASNVVSTILPRLNMPGGLSISSTSRDSLILRWNDNTDYTRGYAIERQISGGQWTEVQRVGASVSSWTDASVDTLDYYTYRIRAFTSLNYSSYSIPKRERFTFNNTPILTITPRDPLGSLYISALVVPADSKSVICAIGRTVGQYDLTTGAFIRNFGSFETQIIGALAISRDGSVIIARGSNDSTVYVWRVADAAQVLAYREFTQTVFSIDLTPNGTSYAIPEWGGVYIRSTKDGTLLRSIAPPEMPNYLVLNYSGELLAVDGMTNAALIYRVSDGALLETLNGHTMGILSMAFNSSGTMLATGSLDHSLKLWDMNGTLLRSFTPGNNYIDGVSFDPTGSYVAGGGLNTFVTVWNLSDGSVARTLTGYSTDVMSTKFTPDGKLFLTGEYSGKIRVYLAYRQWISS